MRGKSGGGVAAYGLVIHRGVNTITAETWLTRAGIYIRTAEQNDLSWVISRVMRAPYCSLAPIKRPA